jgi:hypothetical protein
MALIASIVMVPITFFPVTPAVKEKMLDVLLSDRNNSFPYFPVVEVLFLNPSNSCNS